MIIRTFARNSDPYFPGKDSLPVQGDPDYDEKMGRWWTEVVVNLDRVRERLNSNVTNLDEDIIKAKDDALRELNELKDQLEDTVSNLQGEVSIMAASVSIAGGNLSQFSQLLNNVINQQYSN